MIKQLFYRIIIKINNNFKIIKAKSIKNNNNNKNNKINNTNKNTYNYRRLLKSICFIFKW